MGRGISAESQRNLRRILVESFRNGYGIVPESLRNPSASLAESINSLSKLDSMQPDDSMQISRRFHAEWVAEPQRNLSGIVAESFRNRFGIVPES